MRIMIFAAGGDIGGGKTHILSLAKELSKDNELRLVSFRREVLSREGREMGIDVADIEAKEGMKAAFRFALQQADEYKPQLIHCHGSKANMLGVMVKALRHIPVITTVHSDPRLDYMGAPVREYTYGLINAFALRCMDFHVAVANRMKETLIERHFDPQRIFTIFNGMDFSKADPSPRTIDPDQKEIWIGIAARLNPVKDNGTVIRAFDIAYKQDPRLRLSIAGIGEDEQALKALADELGLSDVVRFEGWISDAKAYFRRIDINVLSSLSETFPYSLLEGAYEHCPAVASNVGGIPSLILQGETGYLFEPGDAESFAKYILRLASDPELRSQLAENLYKKASTEFSLERMKQDQQAIYEAVVRRMARKGERNGAVLCGAYGKGNAGDEAILKAILTELRALDPDMPFWVMSRRPMTTRKKEGVGSFYIFNIFSFFRALRKSALFVNGGGSLIQDITSSRSLYFYLFTLQAAKALGSKVIMYGCGIGPIIKGVDKKIAGRVLDSTADIITLRDSGSLKLLEELGVRTPEIIQAADPTVSLGSISSLAIDNAFEEEGIDPRGNYIGFCLREWPEFKDKRAVAEGARYAYEKYGLTPVFLPIEYPKDTAIGREIASMLDIPCHVCERPRTVDQTMGMLSRMRLVCGMRLHSLIFATAGSTPVIGISYDVKVDSFIHDIGSDALIKLADLNAESLRAQIDNIMAREAELGPQLGQRLRTLEKENSKAAARLLGR